MIHKATYFPYPSLAATGLLFVLFFNACSSSFTEKPDVGNIHTPIPGHPHFSATVSSNIDETGQTQAFISLSILENSLVFKNQQDSLINRLSISIDLTNKDNESVINNNYQLLIGKSPDTNYYEQQAYYREFTHDIAPGNYHAHITVIDLHSGKKMNLSKSLTVPDPKTEEVYVSDIRFYAKQSPSSAFYTVNEYNVNAGFDSLKFSFQLTHNSKSDELEISSTLYRLKADLKPARSMSGKNFRASSLINKGVDYTKKTSVQTINRTLSGSGSVTIDNSFTQLKRGNYRFEASIKNPSGDTYFKVRDFAVKSTSFPQLKSAHELARPLYYLMKKDDYNQLLTIKDPDSLKQKIDTFWLSHIENAAKSREILELYYQRVEQANIRFSNYKEGWKTDKGMIYILFGPPLYTDEGFGETYWIYDFDSGSQTPHIKFKDPRFGNTKFPFDNFQLIRSASLFNLQYRQIQAWTDGSIIYLSQ